MRPHHRATAVVLTLVAVVFAVFFRTLESDFLRWDDDINVFENSRVQGLTSGEPPLDVHRLRASHPLQAALVARVGGGA